MLLSRGRNMEQQVAGLPLRCCVRLVPTRVPSVAKETFRLGGLAGGFGIERAGAFA